ncbi:hypothetical protein LEP1GSC137_0816 [Leptospira borgpetersenii str. Noumea 25]|nr:hypothetical protein LEP1GSC137_0816 [Leptospira borgpetersenii str. Noumea 25]
MGGGERRWEDSGGFLYHKIILLASKKASFLSEHLKNISF